MEAKFADIFLSLRRTKRRRRGLRRQIHEGRSTGRMMGRVHMNSKMGRVHTRVTQKTPPCPDRYFPVPSEGVSDERSAGAVSALVEIHLKSKHGLKWVIFVFPIATWSFIVCKCINNTAIRIHPLKEKEKEMSRCTHSELRASDSQDLGRLDSFSLPSEPPDIRNWYSSYVP
ncbi:hypothetical protein ACS0TY_014030 [Phlomoides rotata]